MSNMLFDTSVIIDHLRGYGPATEFLESVFNSGSRAIISTITEMELFAGKSMLDPATMEKVKRTIELFEIIPVTSEIARQAGNLLRNYRQQGLTPYDALIASTAQYSESSLITRNIKHFRIIKGLIVFNIPVD